MRLLSAGVRVPEIEQALIRQGLEPAITARVVDQALKRKIAVSTQAPPVRSFSWFRVILGLLLAGASLVGIYFCLANNAESVLNGAGAWRGGIRGGIIGGGGGLAVFALNMVRSELMLLFRSEE